MCQIRCWALAWWRNTCHPLLFGHLEDVLGRLPTLVKFSCAPYNLSPGGQLHASPPLPHPHPLLEEIDTREQSPVPTLQDRAGESLEPGDQLAPPRRELNSCSPGPRWSLRDADIPGQGAL